MKPAQVLTLPDKIQQPTVAIAEVGRVKLHALRRKDAADFRLDGGHSRHTALHQPVSLDDDHHPVTGRSPHFHDRGRSCPGGRRVSCNGEHRILFRRQDARFHPGVVLTRICDSLHQASRDRLLARVAPGKALERRKCKNVNNEPGTLFIFIFIGWLMAGGNKRSCFWYSSLKYQSYSVEGTGRSGGTFPRRFRQPNPGAPGRLVIVESQNQLRRALRAKVSYRTCRRENPRA